MQRALGKRRPPPGQVVISKWENLDVFLYPDSAPDNPQNLIGCKLDQESSFDFFFVFFFIKFQSAVE